MLKLRLFNSNVLSAFLYSCECWKMNQQQEKRIVAFENNCLRRILNINWRDHITNQTVRSITHQPLVADIIPNEDGATWDTLSVWRKIDSPER